MPPQRTSRTRATTSGGSCTTPASRRGSTTRRSSSRCSSSATASRTPPTARRPARATCGAATSTADAFERPDPRAVRPRAIAFVGKEAYRGLFASGPSSARSCRALGPTALFVLPSTSPANAAVPYDERLRWFRALRAWLEPVERAGGARARRRRRRARAARPVLRARAGDRRGGATPGGGIEPGESDEEALAARAARGDRAAGVRARPARLRARRATFPWARRLYRQRNAFYLVRVDRHEPAPTIDLRPEGVAEVRWWTLDELDATREQFVAARPRRAACVAWRS